MKKILLLLVAFCLIQTIVPAQSLNDGLKMMQYHRYQSAVNIFNTLTSQNNTDTNAIYWLGIAYIKNKEAAKAVADFQKTIAINAPLLKVGLANAYAADGKKDAAGNALLPYNNTDNITDGMLALAIGDAFTTLGEFSKAKSYYDRAIVLNNKNPDAYILLGTNAMQQGDGTSAYNYFNQAISVDSNYAPAYLSMAEIFISQDNPVAFLPYLKKAIQKDSLYAPAWYEMYRYAYNHDKPKVKKYYSRYLELSDKDQKQEYQLLVLNYEAKNFKKVIETSKKMLNEKGVDIPVDIYKYVGFSYYKMNNVNDAYNNMIKYMQLQDSAKISNYDIYLIAHYATGLKEKDSVAVSYIIKAFQSDTTAANKKFYAVALVNYYNKAGDKYNTALWKEELLPYNGMNKVDLYQAGVSWYELGELQRADSLLKLFCGLYPGEYKGIYMQAGIYTKKDSAMKEGSAVPYFEDFISKAENNTSAEYKPMLEQSYTYLGGYYMLIKEYGKAEENYTKVLKYQPGNKDVRKTIASIKKYMQEMKAYNKEKNSGADK